MIKDYLHSIINSYDVLSKEDKDSIENILKNLVRFVNERNRYSKSKLVEIDKYLKNKLDRDLAFTESFNKDEFEAEFYDNCIKSEFISFKKIRNDLFHRSRLDKHQTDILYKIVWKMIPEIDEFKDPRALNNLLSYFVGVDVKPRGNFKDITKLVQIYKKAFDALSPNDKQHALLELARSVFSEASSDVIDKVCSEVKNK